MQNTETYKKQTIFSAFLTLEALAAIICMAAFWWAVSGVNNEGGPENLADVAHGNDLVVEANMLPPMQLAAKGNVDEAVREAELLVSKKKHDAVANLCAANVFMAAGLYDDGLKYLKKSVALSRRNRFVMLNYAESLAAAGKLDEAIAQYQALINLKVSWGKRNPHMELATLYLAKNMPAEAAAELKSVVAADDKNYAARKLRGIALAKANELKPGLDEYVMASQMEIHGGIPDSVKNILGPDGIKSIDRCMYELEQQVNNRPDDYVPKLRLAQLHAFKGDLQTAKELLTSARMQQSNNVELQRTMAVVLKQLGEDNAAMSAFSMAAKLEEKQDAERNRPH